MSSDAHLLRENATGDAVAWVLVDDVENVETGVSDPVVDAGARRLLAEVKAAVEGLPAPQTNGLTDTQLRATPVGVDVTFPGEYPLPQSQVDALTGGATLTARMLAKSPQDGYVLWFDTGATDYLYILEAPEGTGAGDTGFRGVRITMVSGAPVGPVEVNDAGTLTFTDRATDTGWTS